MSTLRSLLPLSLFVLTAAVAVPVAAAAPSASAPTGVVWIEKTAEFSSLPSAVDVECPEGTIYGGSGFAVVPGFRTATLPSGNATSNSVGPALKGTWPFASKMRGIAYGAGTAPTRLTVFAACLRTAQEKEAGARMGSIEYVTRKGSPDSGVSAACPSGKIVVGGAAGVSPDSLLYALTMSMPVRQGRATVPNVWRARARPADLRTLTPAKPDPSKAAASLWATAVCVAVATGSATLTSPIIGLASAESSGTSYRGERLKEAVARCPAEHKVIGLAGGVTSIAPSFRGRVSLSWFGSEQTIASITAAAEPGHNEQWSAVAYATCAKVS